MPAMQATAITDSLCWYLFIHESKFAQAGAVNAFFADHKNGVVRRHEMLQPEMFAHLHAFFGHSGLILQDTTSPTFC